MQVKAYKDGLVYHEVHVTVPTGGRADAEITLPGPSAGGQTPAVSNASITPSSGAGNAQVTFRMTGTDPQGHANIAEDQVFALNPDLGVAYVLRSAGGDNWETTVNAAQPAGGHPHLVLFHRGPPVQHQQHRDADLHGAVSRGSAMRNGYRCETGGCWRQLCCLVLAVPLLVWAAGHGAALAACAPQLDPELGVPIGEPLRSVAVDSAAGDGWRVEAAWEQAPALTVPLHYGLHGDEPAGAVELRSLHDEEQRLLSGALARGDARRRAGRLAQPADRPLAAGGSRPGVGRIDRQRGAGLHRGLPHRHGRRPGRGWSASARDDPARAGRRPAGRRRLVGGRVAPGVEPAPRQRQSLRPEPRPTRRRATASLSSSSWAWTTAPTRCPTCTS